MAQEKQCKQCGAKFIVEEEDLAFYKKISPTFAGKIYEIPPPTLCPLCREQRRLASRNARSLYKRKCDFCGKDIISMYSPDKDVTVYCQSCWWSDKWDASSFAQEYDSSKTFLEQFNNLKQKVPRAALMNLRSENSEYTNFADGNKNCYLIFLAGNCEDIYYGYYAEKDKSCVDINFTDRSELCYESNRLEGCYRVFWGDNCVNCRESYFIEDCQGCKNCILCSGLNNKQYYYKNKPLSEEEFRKIEAEITDNLDNKLNDYLDEFKSIIRSRPKRFAKVLGSENSNGDNILYSKNCKDSFHMKSCENCRYCYGMEETKDAYDTSGFGIPSELLYECVNVGISSHNCAFIAAGYTLTNCYYCEHCYFSKNLFGCIGIRNHGEYFILNKKYSQEEYEELAATIAEEMTKNNEWGEFYPYELSSFGYNETLANLYYPLNKEGAIKLNAKWQDNLFEPQFSGENYRPVEINKYADDERERNLLLGGILQCEKTGRPFKIMPRELAFYIRNRLPIPKIHYEERFLERFKKMNPNELHHRQCMCEEEGHGHSGRCPNGFETTYAPNRPEKVYCEGCYQKSVI